MKILTIHSFYQVSGGEDSVFKLEANLLRKGHSVKSLSFFNRPGFEGAIQFFISIWNPFSINSLKAVISDFHPDVIHIHNWHYASGPVIIRTLKKLGLPVVITLHNYRLLCPSGSLMDKGHLFINSLNANFPWESIRRRVFRDSYLMTFWLAFVIWFHKKIGTWNAVDKYIVLSAFAKHLYTSSTLNIDSSKFCIKPNFVDQGPIINKDRESFFLYVGRLSEEKGAEVLLAAFQNSDFQIKIAGDGPLAEKVKKASVDNNNIEYLGVLGKRDVLELMQQCSALIFPSIWYEGMPMVILEAFSLGTPVIASNFGAMSSLIQNGVNGLHFEVNMPEALLDILTEWKNYPLTVKQAFSHKALETYERNYTPEANYKMLIDIYQSVINNTIIEYEVECPA
ncbi:hypothetical protein GCM10028806_01670 [Spirosoma terrae]|uniref:Glycosyltransferase family 4 protein n=1 Tax=Spirosoma terrae TaxID=1968276 RepID=A0A6L9LFC0_9BACT|nr:glycosyltransferase family 4 protein [Spirosoma terrae]NDU97573.1 glycosyltransferase family 4 protein [Spirosoma terrae]